MQTYQDIASSISIIGHHLRGWYRPADYGKVVLPLTLLRRLDCVLEQARQSLPNASYDSLADGEKNRGKTADGAEGQAVIHNQSPFNFRTLVSDPSQVVENTRSYVKGFSSPVRQAFERFSFDDQLERLERAGILLDVLHHFARLDLRPDSISNHEMGQVFEELVRHFSEQDNESAGAHFTPRDVVRLTVTLLLNLGDRSEDRQSRDFALYDPACGTGGMLRAVEDLFERMKPEATLRTCGQEINSESYAVCVADRLIRGIDSTTIALGNTLSHDRFPDEMFDFLVSNPPFGLSWKRVEHVVRDEHARLGIAGRFGAGLPRINDGSLLFLQHMVSKWKPPEEGGGRLAVILHGSPLFVGSPGSGEDSIRRWIVDNDWLEAIISLPDQLFYDTSIPTYIWILTNRKSPERRGMVQLINARRFFEALPRSLGRKRRVMSQRHCDNVLKLYRSFRQGETVKIFPSKDFDYRQMAEVLVDKELQKRGASFGYPPKRLEELAVEINHARRDSGSFDEQPNAVYLPTIGNSPAVSSLSELKIKPQNYVQVVLDSDIALADYVAAFFNSDLGLGIRQQQLLGFIPKLNTDAVKRLTVYLPDPSDQAELVAAQSLIRDTRSELETIERRLWNSPRRVTEVRKALVRLNREESLVEWMETLPFPLASILWAYHRDDDPEHQVSQLLNFFEACAEFHAAILIGGFRQDQPLFRLGEFNTTPTVDGHNYPLADFGTWIRVMERLQKPVRECMNNREQRGPCRLAFGMPSQPFLEMVASSELRSIVKDVSYYRNKWKGHGSGALNLRELRARLDVLENYLSRIRSLIQDRYSECMLLSPGTGDWDGEVWRIQVRSLMGTRTPFRNVKITSSVPLNKHNLYMQYGDYDRPIEVASLLILAGTPPDERNAIYFYSRVENDQVRWVSYHFSEEYEKYEPLTNIEPILRIVGILGERGSREP